MTDLTNQGLLMDKSGHTKLNLQNGEASECSRCLWRHVCCGGCAVLATNAGTLGQPSVMCNLMKVVLPAVLKYEGRKIRRKEVKQT